MKRVDFFCTSSSSASICASLHDPRLLVRHSHRPLDLYDSHLHDRKPSPFLHVPCSFKLPFDPKPYNQKSTKTSNGIRRKRSPDVYDVYTPNGSSTYLLSSSSSPIPDLFSDSHSPASSSKICNEKPEISARKSTVKSDPAKSFSSARFHGSLCESNKVVVLRVSLHCKGCEAKVRKHILKMEGVTSFSIDFSSKKVTVIGDVTPLGVLASVSKVKNAELWPLPSSPWSA